MLLYQRTHMYNIIICLALGKVVRNYLGRHLSWTLRLAKKLVKNIRCFIIFLANCNLVKHRISVQLTLILTQSRLQNLRLVTVEDPNQPLRLVELHALEVGLSERLLVVQHVCKPHEEGN